MKKILVLMVAVCLLFSINAWSTPLYVGDVSAPADLVYATSPGAPSGWVPDQPKPSGYYVWANNSTRTSWSIRWTGGENDLNHQDPVYSWWGSIELGEHGNQLVSSQRVLWDNSDGTLSVTDSNPLPFVTWDTISFTATAGWHWDGIDFTIDGEVGNVIGFNLGSTLFNTFDMVAGEGVAGQGVYIGSGYDSPSVYASFVTVDCNDYWNQNFEVNAPVPEPATLLLLGSGLIGLAYLKRRKS